MAISKSGAKVTFLTAFLCIVVSARITDSSIPPNTNQIVCPNKATSSKAGDLISPLGNIIIGCPCKSHEECVDVDHSFCQIENTDSFCSCRVDYTHHPDRSRCLKTAEALNETCEHNVQCQYGKPGNFSVCSGSPTGKCVCGEGAVYAPPGHELANICYEVAHSIGDTCEIDSQCNAGLGHSRCQIITKVCICDEEYVSAPNNRSCLPKKLLGGECLETVQCSTDVEHASCQMGECKCVVGYINPIGEIGECYKKVLNNDVCERDIQCPEQSRCIANTCKCDAGLVSSMNRTKCLPVRSSLGESCEESVQCRDQLKNAECEIGNTGTKICKCSEGRFVESELVFNTCLEVIKERNVRCTENIQCSAGLGPAVCIHDFCQCKLFHGYYEKRCHLSAKLDEPCEHAEQCYVGVNNLTICSASYGEDIKRCSCLPGTFPFGTGNNRKCYATKKIRDPCESNIECTVSIIGPVECDLKTKTCACELGYLSNTDRNRCSAGVLLKYSYSFIVQLLIIVFGLNVIAIT